MSFINYETKQIECTLVYVGADHEACGQNLAYLFERTRSPGSERVGHVEPGASAVQMLPMSLGEIRGFKTNFLLKTFTGAPPSEATRAQVLATLDGVVFIASAAPEQQAANAAQLDQLRADMATHGFSLEKFPRVVQVVGSDQSGALTPAQVVERLGLAPIETFVASPTQGPGVFETLKMICKLVLTELKSRPT